MPSCTVFPLFGRLIICSFLPLLQSQVTSPVFLGGREENRSRAHQSVGRNATNFSGNSNLKILQQKPIQKTCFYGKYSDSLIKGTCGEYCRADKINTEILQDLDWSNGNYESRYTIGKVARFATTDWQRCPFRNHRLATLPVSQPPIGNVARFATTTLKSKMLPMLRFYRAITYYSVWHVLKYFVVGRKLVERSSKARRKYVESTSKARGNPFESSSKARRRHVESSSKACRKHIESSRKPLRKLVESTSKVCRKLVEGTSKNRRKLLKVSWKIHRCLYVHKRSMCTLDCVS